MAFSPITSNQPISYAASRSAYRNSARESLAGGSPVFFVPSNYGLNQYGYGGPRYKYGYTYDNCPTPESNYNGNCTWWCWGRLYEAIGTALSNYGNGANWYSAHQAHGGATATDATDINPGDIICLTDGDMGHVMFVEAVNGNTVTISESAYSTRSIWVGMACLVTTYNKGDIYAGASLNLYKDLDSAAYQTVVGILKTGSAEPGPGPEPSETLEITITPDSYTVTMGSSENYVDMTFNITITGIPAGESVTGGNSYPGLSRVYNSGWSYSDYTVNGVTYRTANKTQTLRYEREQLTPYDIVKHMYFNISKSTGSINTDTPMYIHVLISIILLAIMGKSKTERGRSVIL